MGVTGRGRYLACELHCPHGFSQALNCYRLSPHSLEIPGLNKGRMFKHCTVGIAGDTG